MLLGATALVSAGLRPATAKPAAAPSLKLRADSTSQAAIPALFYACHDAGEAYGAAWFAARAVVLQRRLPPLLASSAPPHLHAAEVRRAAAASRQRPLGRPKLRQGNLSLYSAEHVAMEHGGVLGAEPGALPMKSVDLLHFSVEHLSWVERRLGETARADCVLCLREVSL
jgi:hypothetical protein